MMIFKIAKKELLQSIRDLKSMAIMTLMPLASILILSIAISAVFNHSELSMSNVHLEYLVKGEKGVLTPGFENLMTEMLTDDSNSLLEIGDKKDSINRLKNDEISCLVEIDEGNRTIIFYKNNIYNSDASIIEGVLNTYINRFNAIYEIKSVNSKLLEDMNLEGERNNYITLKSLDKKDDPNAMDYYGVAMCILFVLYSMSMPITVNINEKKKGAIGRILMSPIRKKDLLLGKVLGGVGITTIQFGLVILTTVFIFNVNWGDHPIYAFILIFTLIMMAVSIGTALGLLFDSEEKAMGIIHVLIVIIALFGGSYMPLTGLGTFGEIGKYFSPVWWSIKGVMNMIYSGEMSTLYVAMVINLGIAILFLSIASWKITKKEGLLNG